MRPDDRPALNFATSTITDVIPVATAPKPFTNACHSRPRCFSIFSQCTTIPACDNVNARNAPIAYRGISRSVTPPNRIRISAVNPVSAYIPCE